MYLFEGLMALRKITPKADSVSPPMKPLSLSKKLPGNVQMADPDIAQNVVPNIDLDMREVYFLMLHLLSSGPCQRTYALLRHELLEHELLPRRYHAWYSRSGLPSGDENDDGDSFPLNYAELVKRYSHVKKDHLVELLKQLVFVSSRPTPSRGLGDGNGNKLIAAGVPTLLGTGSFSLLSCRSSDDGTCRIWDARGAQFAPRIYLPRPPSPDGKNNVPSSSNAQQSHQIFCCAFNANGSVFVTGSSDTLARVYSVWSANKINNDDPDQPNHEMDVLAGHENDVNYVQFSGCAAGYKFAVTDYSKDDSVPKFKNSWFCHDNIVTCSRDGSAIIWIPRSRRSHGKSCRWTRAYHLKVPPPPMPPQPPRGGPRQRILPTPRGVNMIAWSLDNRFVLAAIMGNTCLTLLIAKSLSMPVSYSALLLLTRITFNVKIVGYACGMPLMGACKAKNTDGVAVDAHLAISNGLPNGDERCLIVDGSPSRMADDGASKCSQDVTGPLHDLKDSLPPLSRTLRIRSKRASRAPDTSLKQEVKSSSMNEENGGSVALNDGSADTRCDLALESQNDGVVGTEQSLRNDSAHESNPPISDPVSIANDVHVSHPKRMFDFVYRRLKSRKHKNNSDGGATLSQEISLGSCSQDQSSSANSHEVVANGFRGTESNGLEKSEGSLTDSPNKLSNSRGNQNSQEEERSTSGATLRLRSTRNRRSTYPFSETKPAETKKPQQSTEKVSWLTLSTHEEGSRYIPQKGDEVAYLRQGHQEYLNFSSPREVAPWTSVKGGNMKPVEICKVESLEYATLAGSGDSCCKMILKVIDPNSEVFNKTFKLTLPDVVTFPDFLVERSRYEAAIQRNWTFRDKCKVWWRDEGEEDGSWWEGRILAVKAKSPDFPDSPWERYTVKYKSDPTETHLHSPWELFDADTKWEQPHIDDDERKRLLLALTKLETSNKRTKDSYGLQKLNQTVGSSSYTNMFPVPLSLEVIRSRLENNYYRSVEALRHDVAVMLSNAETFFGRNKSVAAKISHLSKWFDRTLPS
ncbi:hypothetical protein F2Q70_00032193 [Brassica cretica]|uniref:Bromo domain-containing protein n=1 Tax=Brassica cretica TaxID=69181 RepID=A0A8S9FJ55_BRACR|nr:hypothetical protein F2Q70_00032193 [Brassica cretica]